MSGYNIDLNRGVMIKRHQASGVYVNMYLDTPGIYLNDFGKEVTPELAEAAGYDIVALGKQKLKRERMAAAMNAIELEMALADGEPEDVALERGGFKVVKLALGNANVFDEDNNKVNARPIPLAEAQKLMDFLAPKTGLLRRPRLQPKPVPGPLPIFPEGAKDRPPLVDEDDEDKDE